MSQSSSHSTSSSLPQNYSSRSKVAVITGAAKGIGRAIALRLAHDGYDIAVNDLQSSSSSLESLCKIIRENMARKAVALLGDISSEKDVKGLIDGTVKELGKIDIMVANAGICWPKAILNTTTDDWDSVHGVNGRGTFMCYKYAAEQMIKQGQGGRIIGASSIAGKRGLPYFCAYSASKFAVSALTQIAAREWAKHSITVNAYAPGPIETDMMKASMNLLEGVDSNFTSKSTISTAALGFNGTPDDVAGLVSYLVSDQGRFITGQVITIDGGVIFQ